jgi:ribulose-5-phosphate 4-epimerase/fuculose-1-phosphate aldolase
MDTIETLNEYIEGHFNGLKTERQEMLAFTEYRDEVLTSILEMNSEFLAAMPAAAAVGFLGKLDFKEGAHLNAFIAKPDMTTLAKLREHGVVGVADSARAAWSHLLATNESAACNILGLCALARKHPRVIALKPKAKKVAASR